MTTGTGLAGMRAAYLRPSGTANWSRSAYARQLDALAAAGIDTVVTKLRAAEDSLVEECRSREIRVVGSFGCFIDHALPADVPPALRPVDDRGHVFEPMRWYHGVIPTSQTYLDDLAAELATQLDDHPTDGVILDFIRWPCHWERELRPGADWRRSSFDPITLARFNDYLDGLGAAGVDPDDPVRAAEAVGERLATPWLEFRCDVVADACRRLTEVIVGSGRWTGAFVVPATDELRREVVGQDTRRLSELVDVLLPMTYHALMRQSVRWLSTISADVAATTAPAEVVSPGSPERAAVVAMVQGPATDDDWGIEEGAAEFVDALAAATTWPGSAGGFCVFPGDELGSGDIAAIAAHR